MVERAKLLVDDLLCGYLVRQCLQGFPIALRLLLARYLTHLSKVLQIVHWGISTDIVHRSGFLKTEPTIIHKILSQLDKQDTPITVKTFRTPPLNESIQPALIDDFVIQREFDFGA